MGVIAGDWQIVLEACPGGVARSRFFREKDREGALCKSQWDNEFSSVHRGIDDPIEGTL